MDDAIAVVIIADRAVKHVVLEQTVERLPLRGIGPDRLGLDNHARSGTGGAGARQLSIDLDQAGVASLDGTKLVMITDTRNLGVPAQQEIDEKFA